MRVALVALGLCCLVGYVYSDALPSIAEFIERAVGDDETENDEIVGGTAAKVGEFPYLAGLNLKGYVCGGSLIAPDIILTAAHCLYGLGISASDISAVLNSTSYSGGRDSVKKTVRKYVIHPTYNPSTHDNDVALLALTSPATGIQTIALPCPKTAGDFAGKTASIAGYGTTSSGGTSISNTLLKANVNIISNVVCNQQYNNINNNKICASAPGKDTCQGDSGGPLVVSGVLVGVTSYGRGCADPSFAGVYARVTTYVDWILETKATI